jgi:Ca2+-binding EF-hand superfamily protein
MMTTYQLFANKKHALIAICVLLGFSEPVFAGSHDAPVNREAQSNAEEVVPQIADEDAQDLSDQQTLGDEVSSEDRALLRRDLDTYSRSADPDHVLLEERRRMMRKQIQERFFAADRDNDGSLSRVEATETLPQIARHFSEVDLNGDDVITINELAEAQAKADERQRMAETKLEEARLNEIKEAKLQVKRKGKQATANRKRSL